MAEVFPQNILLRVGGYTMRRHGVWAVAGSRRGPVEVPITFSRADPSTLAAYVDAGGLVQRAAAGVIRPDYEPYYASGLVLPDGTPAFGPRIEGSRQNLLVQSEAFNTSWTLFDVTVSSNVDVAPDGTTTADRLVEDTSVSAEHIVYQTLSGTTADVRHASSIFAKAGTRSWLVMTIRDVAGMTNGVHAYFNLATGVVGTVGHSGVGSGEQAFIVKYPNGWYRCILVGAMNAGDTSPLVTFGMATGDNGRLYTGDGASYLSVWGAQFENNTPVPSSYVKTTAAALTRAIDSFTVPVNFGPQNLTVKTIIARPLWADVTGDIGFNPGLWQIGTTDPQLRGYAAQASRVLSGDIQTPTTDSFPANQAIPGGATLTHVLQFKEFPTGGKIAMDIGAGFGAFGVAATIFAAFQSQVLDLGHVQSTGSLFGVLLDLVVYRGLFSYAEVVAAP